MDFQNQYKN